MGELAFGKVSKIISNIFTSVLFLLIISFVCRVITQLTLSGEAHLFILDEILPVFLMGARFDAKIGVIVGILIALPNLFFKCKAFISNWTRFIWFVALSILISNYYYFSFYHTPFNALMFGLVDDDTIAIIQTMWHDFPILRIVLGLVSLSLLITYLQNKITNAISNRLTVLYKRPLLLIPSMLIALTLIVFLMKGTLHGVALQRQHMIVTNNTFLNDIVPNGISALYYAYSAKKDEPSIEDVEYMVHQLGFDTVFDAARVLGIEADDTQTLLDELYQKHVPNSQADKPQDLIFFLMESMGAEPFLYHSTSFDLLGKLSEAKQQSCHFSNFDAIQSGTFPSLEGILYHTPITPLTQGKYAYQTMPWSIASTLQRAGYHTVFFTGGRSSWRNLDQSLLNQGFDEIIDAGALLETFPNIEMDMWGIPDEYLFEKIQSYRDTYVGDKPLFIFALTITNHPPYTLPKSTKKIELDLANWKGDTKDPLLEANLLTYRYAADQLGQFVINNQSDVQSGKLIIAATGDHNARTFGLYSGSGQRQYANQVPFLLWANQLDCGHNLTAPTSHRDMFTTIFPLLNTEIDYLSVGRNLLAQVDVSSPINQIQTAVQFTGEARDAHVGWNIFDNDMSQPNARFECFDEDESKCVLNKLHIDVERARFALSDWHIRYQLSQPNNRISEDYNE